MVKIPYPTVKKIKKTPDPVSFLRYDHRDNDSRNKYYKERDKNDVFVKTLKYQKLEKCYSTIELENYRLFREKNNKIPSTLDLMNKHTILI